MGERVGVECSVLWGQQGFFSSLLWDGLTLLSGANNTLNKSWLPGKSASVKGQCVTEQAWSLFRHQRFPLSGLLSLFLPALTPATLHLLQSASPREGPTSLLPSQWVSQVLPRRECWPLAAGRGVTWETVRNICDDGEFGSGVAEPGHTTVTTSRTTEKSLLCSWQSIFDDL